MTDIPFACASACLLVCISVSPSRAILRVLTILAQSSTAGQSTWRPKSSACARQGVHQCLFLVALEALPELLLPVSLLPLCLFPPQLLSLLLGAKLREIQLLALAARLLVVIEALVGMQAAFLEQLFARRPLLQFAILFPLLPDARGAGQLPATWQLRTDTPLASCTPGGSAPPLPWQPQQPSPFRMQCARRRSAQASRLCRGTFQLRPAQVGSA